MMEFFTIGDGRPRGGRSRGHAEQAAMNAAGAFANRGVPVGGYQEAFGPELEAKFDSFR
jgi:methyl-accepting chemotaxis protein